MEKIEQNGRMENDREGVLIAKGLSEEETSELRPGLPGAGSSRCEGPGAGVKLKCAKDGSSE